MQFIEENRQLIIILLSGGFIGGFITGAIQIISLVNSRRDKRRELLSALEEQERTDTAERNRMSREGQAETNKELRQIIQDKKEECERLEKKIQMIEQNSSLSGITVTGMYRSYRELGADIGRIEVMAMREVTYDILRAGIEDLKKTYDQLGDKMP